MFFLLGLIFYSMPLDAQEEEDIATYIILDDVVVTATQGGFDVEEFVTMVQEDRSFYEAFRNLRRASYHSNNQMKFFDKNQEIRATYDSQTRQSSTGYCRQMEVLSEEVRGNFFKRKKQYRYYTAKMYDKVFFTHGIVCDLDTTLIVDKENQNLSGLEKYYQELKKLIFLPGSQIDIPLIGKKAAIFEDKLRPYYNYTISSEIFQDSIDCYAFSVVLKEEEEIDSKNHTIISNLKTYFRKKDFQVVGRNYTLKHGGLITLDITMNVSLLKRAGKYLPEQIEFDGTWDVPFKPREQAYFKASFYRYQ